jgi:hypothetical protein
LFYQNEVGGRQVLIVLAFGEQGLWAATERLLLGDYAGCLIDEDRRGDPAAIGLALCPTAYEPQVADPTPTPLAGGDAEATLPPAVGGQVLIVSDDDGEGVYEWWNSAYLLYDTVSVAGYEPLIWSTNFDGEVLAEQLQAYDAILWCTGDYQDEGGNPSAAELLMLGQYMEQGGGVLLIGAFLGEPEGRESGLILDIQVAQSGHALAEGFDADQVVTLERFTADQDYVTWALEDVGSEAVAWVRGPESELAGVAVVSAHQEDLSDGRLAVVGAPLYLLPYAEGSQLAANAFQWLVDER